MQALNLLFKFTLFIFSPIFLFSQSEEEEYPFPDDTLYLINEKINTYESNNYDLTKKYTLDLLEYSRRCEEEEIILLSYFALEYYSYDFDKRDDFNSFTVEADSVYSSIIQNENFSKYADYYFFHLNYYSIYLFRKNKIEEADLLISNAIKLLKSNTFDQNIKDYYLTTFYRSLSSFKELQWNFKEGISLLEKASEYQENSEFSSGYISQNYSSYHQKIGNYSEALNYGKLALKNYEKVYSSKPNIENSIFYSLSIIKLAELYIYLGKYKKAASHLQELKALPFKKTPLIKTRILKIQAKINLFNQRVSSALKDYNQSLKIQQEKLPNRITEIVDIYQSIAEIYKNQNQIDSTLSYLQSAVVTLTNNPDFHEIEGTPTQFQDVFYRQELLDILYFKSSIFIEKYKQSKDICDLQLALKTSESSQDLADKIRLELSSNSDKEFFSKKGNKIYAQAMQIVSLLQEIEPAAENLDIAYRAMESSRALLLAEAVYQSNTKEFADIPKELLKREEKLREQIVEQERRIFHLEQEGENAEKYKKERLKLQAEFDNFTDILKDSFPTYYNLKFAAQRPDIESLQKDLASNNQTFVEYFLDDEIIYALIIAKDRYELKSWQRPTNLKEKIKNLRSSIYEGKNYNSSITNFAHYADTLYQDLVLPLGDLSERLVIVPDGVLNYLPFDVLLTEKPKVEGNYQDYPFLLNQLIISYDYSATLHLQERKVKETSVDFKGFAPQYDMDDPIASRGVGNLKHNIEEVDFISHLYKGVAFTKDTAHVQRFKEESGDTWILHFAGHAVQEEINPDFSHLLFSAVKDSTNFNTNQLPVRDIYARSIAAEMVVLSACNTGMGEILKGEGMYSLGRAFSYAGANSLVSTLWSVNDKSTMDIMILFYENLRKGMTKDKALQIAKQKYITKSTHKNSQPLFWAGFVAYGDMDALFYPWFAWKR